MKFLLNQLYAPYVIITKNIILDSAIHIYYTFLEVFLKFINLLWNYLKLLYAFFFNFL